MSSRRLRKLEKAIKKVEKKEKRLRRKLRKLEKRLKKEKERRHRRHGRGRGGRRSSSTRSPPATTRRTRTPPAPRPRRYAYTPQEDQEMWQFLIEEVQAERRGQRTRPEPVNPMSLSTWREFVGLTGTVHTAPSIQSHFRRVLLPQIDQADADPDDLLLLAAHFQWLI